MLIMKVMGVLRSLGCPDVLLLDLKAGGSMVHVIKSPEENTPVPFSNTDTKDEILDRHDDIERNEPGAVKLFEKMLVKCFGKCVMMMCRD